MQNTGPDKAVPVHVAVGVVTHGECVLIARRPPGKHLGGLLEFPGGKVDPGESVRHALVRELAEEVALEADAAAMEPLIQIEHDYGDKSVLLDVWRVMAFKGVARGLEGQSVDWVRVATMNDADFPVANRPIIRALRLPSEWLVTGASDEVGQISRNLTIALSARSRCGLLLRQPQLAADAYLRLAHEVLPLCKGHGIPLVLHGAPSLLQVLPEAAGIHLSQSVVRQLADVRTAKGRCSSKQTTVPASEARPVAAQKWLGVSCHSPAELADAALIGADYGTLSPLNPTSSHPGREPLGWDNFRGWVRSARFPVYAMGGVGQQDIPSSIGHGGQGIAGISHWWR